MRRERARWDKDREEFEELRRTLEANSENGSTVNIEELSQLQSDRSALNMRVQQLEHQLAEAEHRLAAQSEGQNTTEIDDLQRRFELAIDDVRELKHRNAELEEALAEIQSLGGDAGSAVNGRDWNATKSRLTALLNQGEQDESIDANDRLTVEGAIRITDDIVAQRDEEIVALKEQLAQQSGEPAEPGAAAASNDQLFNQDDIIRQERERLAALNQELREKLRQAEVDLSVQRAGLARERAQLQEKLRIVETEREELAAQQPVNPAAAGGKPKKPARRWMERMGLKEQDQE